MRKKLIETVQPDIPVAIGLCVKNAEKTIRKCAESIVNQNYPKRLVTVLVVDGKSRDKTVEITRKLLLSSGLSSRFYSDNGEGLGAARQIVLDHAHEKYIIWIDGDATIYEDFVREQVKFMEKKTNVSVATGTFVYLKNHGESLPSSLENIEKYVGSITFPQKRSDRGLPPNDTSIYRVKALKQIGGFDTSIRGASEDEDVITRMRRKGWGVTVNPNAIYHAFPKATWQSIWKEGAWFGSGQHYLSHKDKTLRVVFHHIPLIIFFGKFKASYVAYKLTSEKKVFLLPLAGVFFTMAWWYGYLQAHLGGYGHYAAK
jgi:glycosyltransferase involved in cell wall biosynthesis